MSPSAVYASYAEYLRSPIFRVVRSLALRRTGGRCACGAEAHEVHHPEGRYPPWGTFDVPADLSPICHACHCREHGVER